MASVIIKEPADQKQPSSNDTLQILPKSKTLELRSKHIGGSVTLFFKEDPLKIVRGEGQRMYDDEGNSYLDCINNVAHVGHCHPHVTELVSKQMSLLYTNSRYLHDNLVLYAKRITDKMPGDLSICYFVNSGSEANDLALRLARAYTKHQDVIVLEGAYHGHLTSTMEMSPYKLKHMGQKPKEWVHIAPLPCSYRGKYTRDEYPENQIGSLYAKEIRDIISKARSAGRNIAAFFAESMISCGGQVVLPPSYLAKAYEYVHEAGGICVADEVQVGFGRSGKHFWSFEQQGVIPDIVVIGKSIGNGFPVSCVVTTPKIAKAFQNIGTEYFNTFGGNPVSAAAALAVLDVLEKENLMEKAKILGENMINKLKQMQHKYEVVGDVRGSGLFIGVDLVRSKETKEPAPEIASYAVRRFKENKILMSTEGIYGNVLKFKPPMVFNAKDAAVFLDCLERILKEIELEMAKPKSTIFKSSSVDSMNSESMSTDSYEDSFEASGSGSGNGSS